MTSSVWGSAAERAEEERRRREAAQRRLLAAEDFPELEKLAKNAGVMLLKHSDSHYSLRTEDWRLNIYPGNLRLHRDRGPERIAETLPLPEVWSLSDVVRLVVSLVEEDNAGAEESRSDTGGESAPADSSSGERTAPWD